MATPIYIPINSGKGNWMKVVKGWTSLGGSESKEPACNAGDLGLIPGLGRFPGEGNDNPL